MAQVKQNMRVLRSKLDAIRYHWVENPWAWAFPGMAPRVLMDKHAQSLSALVV